MPVGSTMDREFPTLPMGRAATRGSSVSTAFISGLSSDLDSGGISARNFFGVGEFTPSGPTWLAEMWGGMISGIRSWWNSEPATEQVTELQMERLW